MRTAVVCLLLFGALGGTIHAQDAKSTAAGVFTAAQAKKGEAAYNSNCASCHGADLRSTDREVTNLTETAFKNGWIGKTIAQKFEVTRDTMPPRAERSLGDQVYLDIVTYILQFNKVPLGQQELKPDPQILRQIVIADPAS
jgi:mono/diheme cytochrome c family protein